MSTSANPSASDKSFWNVVLPDGVSKHNNPKVAIQSQVAVRTSSNKNDEIESKNKRDEMCEVLLRPGINITSTPSPEGEYRYKCKEEGCSHKYKHRSSRSRHARLAHKTNVSAAVKQPK